MAILTKYSDSSMTTYLVSGSLSRTTVIRYTLYGIDHTISIAVSDTTAILALMNSWNIGAWYYDAGVYTCYYCKVSAVSFRTSDGGGTSDITFAYTVNDYLRDYENTAMAVELETVTTSVPRGIRGLNYGTCPCSCEFEEKVFSGDTEANLYESDRTSYLFKKFDSGDGYDIKLVKNGTTEITISSAIAKIWDYGDLQRPDLTSADDYSGFLIYWFRVFAIYGYGSYRLVGTETINGTTSDYLSHVFKLYAYNKEIAKYTVKIETLQNGYIESETMDLTGFNWYQSVRIDGKLTKLVPKLIEDNFLNSAREVIQIQDQIINNWELELLPLPASVANFIAYNATLSNQMLVSDYNINPQVYDQQNIQITEISQFKSWAFNTNIRGTFKAVDRVQNIIKRNYS